MLLLDSHGSKVFPGLFCHLRGAVFTFHELLSPWSFLPACRKVSAGGRFKRWGVSRGSTGPSDSMGSMEVRASLWGSLGFILRDFRWI